MWPLVLLRPPQGLMRLREDGAVLSLAEHVLAQIWSSHSLRECQGLEQMCRVSRTDCLFGLAVKTVADKS